MSGRKLCEPLRTTLSSRRIGRSNPRHANRAPFGSFQGREYNSKFRGCARMSRHRHRCRSCRETTATKSNSNDLAACQRNKGQRGGIIVSLWRLDGKRKQQSEVNDAPIDERAHSRECFIICGHLRAKNEFVFILRLKCFHSLRALLLLAFGFSALWHQEEPRPRGPPLMNDFLIRGCAARQSANSS